MLTVSFSWKARMGGRLLMIACIESIYRTDNYRQKKQECRIHFSGSNHYIVVSDVRIALVTNGISTQELNLVLHTRGLWHQVHLVLERNMGMPGGVRFRFFMDNRVDEQMPVTDNRSMEGLWRAFYIGDNMGL